MGEPRNPTGQQAAQQVEAVFLNRRDFLRNAAIGTQACTLQFQCSGRPRLRLGQELEVSVRFLGEGGAFPVRAVTSHLPGPRSSKIKVSVPAADAGAFAALVALAAGRPIDFARRLSPRAEVEVGATLISRRGRFVVALRDASRRGLFLALGGVNLDRGEVAELQVRTGWLRREVLQFRVIWLGTKYGAWGAGVQIVSASRRGHRWLGELVERGLR